MSLPKISIIIPTYNGGPYLKLLLDSILIQSFQDFEVLLVDDCSTDESWSIMNKYGSDARFRIFQWKPNRGAHAGTWFLLSQMRGQYWCYPGADDVLAPQFLQERLGVMESNPNCALVHGRANYIDQNGHECAPQTPDMDIPEMMPGKRALDTILQHDYINAPSVMVRSSTTRLILPQFCGMMFYPMDWYLWILIASTGFDFAWDPRPLHSYRVHPTSNSLIPEKQAVRSVEQRLAPLLALKKASGFSDVAMNAWARFGHTLYLHTLHRCWQSRKSKSYNPDWMRQAMVAAGRPAHSNLALEHFINVPAIFYKGLIHKKSKSNQLFSVSGLAEINEPLFKP